MAKAFTLVEIIVAVGIISIAGLGLLKTHSDNTKLISRMSTRYALQDDFSLILLNADLKYNGTSKDLFALVEKKFKIDNDELKSLLKAKSFKYSQKEFSNIKLLESKLDELEEDFDKSALPDLSIKVEKISMQSTQGSSYGYGISLQ